MSTTAERPVGLMPLGRSRRRRRPPLLIVACIAFMTLVGACALTGTLLAPQDPMAQDLASAVQGSSGSHPLGTDDSGRDILSRVIAGARAAVVGPVLVALGALLLGSVLGLLAGYRGGWFDAVIMRSTDFVYALPALLVAIFLLGILGGGYYAAVVALVVLTAPGDVRIIRGATLEQRTRPYVDAARTLGLSQTRIMFRHILPNLTPLLVTTAFLDLATALVSLSALSFLGFGAGPGAADWGRMLSENLPLIEDNPLAALAPGAALVLTATSMNLLGDWLYEALSNRGRAR